MIFFIFILDLFVNCFTFFIIIFVNKLFLCYQINVFYYLKLSNEFVCFKKIIHWIFKIRWLNHIMNPNRSVNKNFLREIFLFGGWIEWIFTLYELDEYRFGGSSCHPCILPYNFNFYKIKIYFLTKTK